MVLAYCAAVRGILNDDQSEPLHPPGLRMAKALKEVRASLGRNLELNRPRPSHRQLGRLARCIDRALAEAKNRQQKVRSQVKEIREVAATLDIQVHVIGKAKATIAGRSRLLHRADPPVVSGRRRLRPPIRTFPFAWTDLELTSAGSVLAVPRISRMEESHAETRRTRSHEVRRPRIGFSEMFGISPRPPRLRVRIGSISAGNPAGDDRVAAPPR